MTDHQNTIVVTGAAGFIGSRMAAYLNERGFDNLVLVDDFGEERKKKHAEDTRAAATHADRIAKKRVNLDDVRFSVKVDRDHFFEWMDKHGAGVSFMFHLGARTDTTEFDYEVHRKLNLEYSQKIWKECTARSIPLVYASSAATYGGGEAGYDDDHKRLAALEPLNPYGLSKHRFDLWALEQETHPPFWAGLKFFNVYGPYEYHKGRMASVVWHAYQQILGSGEVKLFRSHRPEFKDGEQLRDFIYVKDILKVCYWLMQTRPASGIYNLGTGVARTFTDLVKATFSALHLPPRIRFIDMPEDIREKYQYFTEAKMEKLRKAGYREGFYSLEEGVKDYISSLPALEAEP